MHLTKTSGVNFELTTDILTVKSWDFCVIIKID